MDYAFISDAPLTLADAGGNAPTSRIQVAEIGKFSDPGRYGDFAVTADEVANWQKVLAEHFKGEIPIDVDHHTDRGISSEAAGWIKSIVIAGARVLADVEWTPLGASAIREKRYKFISPTFVGNLRNQIGEKLGPALLRAALTNSPFLASMPAVSLCAAPILAERVDDGYHLADFTQGQRDELASKGHALPDGSFPIRNRADLENAVKAYGRAKDQAAAKAHIIQRAKAIGCTDCLPEDWTTSLDGAPPAEHTGKDAPDLQIVDDVVSKRKCPHCDHEMDADTPDDAVMCAACRKKYLDAPVSIMVGDRVAESLKDLSLGKHGTCVHTWALAEGGPGVEGMIVHDVTWDDGTRSLGVQGFYLRCLTPWRSLEAVPVGLSYLVALARP